jgi:hypothetical protein
MATRMTRIRRINTDLSVTIRLIRVIRVAITNLNLGRLCKILYSIVCSMIFPVCLFFKMIFFAP